MKANLEDLLVCPADREPLEFDDEVAKCAAGHSFPVVQGIPVLLLDQLEPTHASAVTRTRELVSRGQLPRPDGPPAESTEYEVDPFVQSVVAAAAGRLYKNCREQITRYPIPNFPRPNGAGRLLLDVGCNWGRWCIAAARERFVPVGIDPSLEAVAAARRVADQLETPATYLVGDARALPFRADTFRSVFSYSVIQHFSRDNARAALEECARVLAPEQDYLVQMPNKFGLMSLYHQLSRGFREGRDFEVRYWSPKEVQSVFNEVFGSSDLSVDGYFGLGVGAAKPDDLTRLNRWIVRLSWLLTRISSVVPPLQYVADSLYVFGQNTLAASSTH